MNDYYNYNIDSELERNRIQKELREQLNTSWKKAFKYPMTEADLIIAILDLWKKSASHATAVYHSHSPCCNKDVLKERIDYLLSQAILLVDDK